MDYVDLRKDKFELETVGAISRNRISKKKPIKIKIINYSKKIFGSFKEIFEVKPKTPLPGVNLANAFKIAVS